MKVSKKFFSLCLAEMALLLGALGCTGLTVKELPASSNPSTEISNLQTLRDEAKRQQVDVLSPKNYAAAESSLEKAKNSRSEDADTKEILKHVAIGRANLEKADEVANIARTTMPGVIAARELAISANAPKLFEKRFKESDSSLASASSDLEQNSTSKVEKSRDSLTKQYSDLELDAILKNSIGGASATIDQAIKEGAEESSARTLKLAKQSVTDAHDFIVGNRHDGNEIARYTTLANDSANHLLDVTRQVKVAEKKDSEFMVLRNETQQEAIKNGNETNAIKESELAKMKSDAGALSSRN